MTRSIKLLYGARDGGSLTPEECAEINEDLAILDPTNVPDDQIDNVVDYLDRQFLYQQVDARFKEQLEKLFSALKLRTL